MKILFLTQYFTPEIGAAPVRLTAIAEALQTAGHEVTVATSLPNYPTGRTFDRYRRRLFGSDRTPAGVNIKRVWTYPAQGSGIRRYVNYLSFVAMSPLLLWRVPRPDVILVESPPLTTAIPGAVFSLVKGAPVILNVADLWPDAVVGLGLVDEGSLIVKLARKLEAWAYKSAALISHASYGFGRELERKGVPPSKLVLLPNGADLELFRPMPPNNALKSDLGLEGKKVLLYAGTHSVLAGMDVLVDTAEELANDEDIVLVLVGDGPTKANLQARADERDLDNMMFLDPVQPEVVADLYSIAVGGLVTVAENPQLTGVRPAKMFPPLACGKPVLFSGWGEGADLVKDNDIGIVTELGDAVGLAEAVRSVVASPSEADRLGKNGRRFILENLTWAVSAARWASAVQERLHVGKAALDEGVRSHGRTVA